MAVQGARYVKSSAAATVVLDQVQRFDETYEDIITGLTMDLLEQILLTIMLAY